MRKEDILREFPFLQYEDVIDEELEDYYHWLINERNVALRSYNEGDEIRYCSSCGEPMVKGCLAYDEGFHFDSCI